MPSKNSWGCTRARWAALALAIFLAGGAVVAQAAPRLGRLDGGGSYREDRILIVPKAGRTADLERLHRVAGAKVRKRLPNFGGIQVLEVPPGISAQELVRRYRQSGHVEAADLDIQFQSCALPNDPRVIDGQQWHLNNFGQNAGLIDADIDAPEAWDTLNSASNIVVAIVDSGARLTHEDLAPNLWVNSGEIPGNGVDDDANGVIDDVHGINTVPAVSNGNPSDDAGHGTHVAGIIGAVGNNGRGGSGVAWRVKLMPCKFLDASGNGFLSDLIDCFDYARTNGARIINCSFETPGPLNTTLSNAFWRLRQAGIIVTAAAGNSGVNIDASPRYPASFALDNIVSVMALSRTDAYLGYNYGVTSVDLAAPGFDVVSTWNSSDSAYVSLSGTSMASPCVAGAAALVWAKFPQLTHQQVVSRILGTVDVLPALSTNCVTSGRLNVARALSGGFGVRAGVYSWVPTNGMTFLSLADDGVSAALPLPFSFQLGGRDYSQLYAGANGLLGFVNLGLGLNANTDLPTSTSPNSILCPLWDNLNPAAGGSVWFGTFGQAPHRRAVVSWVDVPHSVTAGGQTRFTFQTILHESQEIVFQYASVQAGNASYVSGRSATIGLEDFAGAVAAKYSFNAVGAVTNNQAIVFVPDGGQPSSPVLVRLVGPQPGQFRLRILGPPSARCVLQSSVNLSSWSNLATNTIPGSGMFEFNDTGAMVSGQKFYRATFQP